MSRVKDYRRANVRKLAESLGGVTELGKKLGYANSSFIVQMCGPKPIRQVSESTARRFERMLDLLPGSLDVPVELDEKDTVSSDDIHVRQVNQYRKRKGIELLAPDKRISESKLMSHDQLASVVNMVGKICDEVQINIPTSKLADTITLALLIYDEKKLDASEKYIRLLVSLTK